MKLVKYRDAGMNTHTYFWKNDNNSTVSPYFDTDKEALSWATEKGYEIGSLEDAEEFARKRNDPWNEWKATKDIV